MSNKRKIFLLLACISLIICIASTSYTYAKYFTRTDGHIGSNIKTWEIKINEESVRNGQQLSEKITAYFDESIHVANDKMAPGSSGYFLIEVDYSGVELSFNYEISIEENADLTDISIYKLEVDGQEITTNDGFTVSNDIIQPDNDEDKKKQIKVYIKWNDDETNGATMDNKADTEIPINNETIDFNVGIKITQLV